MPGVWKLLHMLIYTIVSVRHARSSNDVWPLDRPEGMPSIQSLEVMCGKDHMDVHLSFTQPFEGIVSSKGQHSDPRCIYVPPSTSQTFFTFRIAYARCGTKPDMHGQFYENTVVVQYDKDLLEVWDEAKRLRCEWFNDYEKTASKPPMVIADLDVIQLDFRGDNVDCWMEIQHGKGPWAPPVSGIVPLGSTLTLVVAINDYRGNKRHSKVQQGEFDMRVKSCIASDGVGHTIQLSDEFGCVLRPKMISKFLKSKGSDDRATVITYAFFHAFKFPDALSVNIKCKVEICRHGCLDHCQNNDQLGHFIQERNDHQQHQYIEAEVSSSSTTTTASATSTTKDTLPIGSNGEESAVYDDIVQHGDDVTSIGSHFLGVEKSSPSAQAQMMSSQKNAPPTTSEATLELSDDPVVAQPFMSVQPARVTRYQPQESFPHGPRNLDEEDDREDSNSHTPQISHREGRSDSKISNGTQSGPVRVQTNFRRKRSVVVSDRKARSADIGVSGIYEVISESDLAFVPDQRGEAVTVFQGRIREETVYGVCLPISGFSALFVLMTMSAIISALVAGAMVHRLQAQREMERNAQQAAGVVGNGEVPSSYGWLQAYGFFKGARCAQRPQTSDIKSTAN